MNRNRARQMRAKKIRTLVCMVLTAVILVLAGLGVYWTKPWQQTEPADNGTVFAENGTDPLQEEETDRILSSEKTEADTDAAALSEPAETGKPTLVPTAEPTMKPAAEPTEEPTTEGTPEPVTEASAAPAPAPAPPVPTEVPLPLAGLIIGIDPGHQAKGDSSQEAVAPDSTEMKMKVSGGTQGVATRVPEYVVNLQVGLLLRDRLIELGAQVVMTRETHDVNISNQERAAICNDAGAHLVLRLHCNGANDQSVDGISLFVRATGNGAEEALAAAEALMPAMLEATGADNYGIYRRDSYTGLNWSVPPSILVEMGFMSNPAEDEKLCDPEYQQKLVAGMVQGVADYFGREISEVSE